jgi:hypothetical protein
MHVANRFIATSNRARSVLLDRPLWPSLQLYASAGDADKPGSTIRALAARRGLCARGRRQSELCTTFMP